MSGSWSLTGAQRVGTPYAAAAALSENKNEAKTGDEAANRNVGIERFSLSHAQDADEMRVAHAAAKAARAQKSDKLQKTTQDFEAVFVGMMLKQMRKSLAGQNALFGNSSEAKMYQDMMDDATAQRMSKTGTFGLAQVLFKTMSKTLPPDPDQEY